METPAVSLRPKSDNMTEEKKLHRMTLQEALIAEERGTLLKAQYPSGLASVNDGSVTITPRTKRPPVACQVIKEALNEYTEPRVSVRGVEGGVASKLQAIRQRKSMMAMTWKEKWAKIMSEEEKKMGQKVGGKIVIYTTSMKVIMPTYSACCEMLRLLQNMRVEFENRDIFLNPQYNEEIEARAEGLNVPLAFLNGKLIGNHNQLTMKNETGLLKELFADVPKIAVMESGKCSSCGGSGFVNCGWCHGSQKSISTLFGSLRCTACNENGLYACTACQTTPSQKEISKS